MGLASCDSDLVWYQNHALVIGVVHVCAVMGNSEHVLHMVEKVFSYGTTRPRAQLYE